MSDQTRAVEWISIKELRRRTSNGVSESHLRKLAQDGKIEAVRLGEKKWLVAADAIDRLRQQQATPA